MKLNAVNMLKSTNKYYHKIIWKSRNKMVLYPAMIGVFLTVIYWWVSHCVVLMSTDQSLWCPVNVHAVLYTLLSHHSYTSSIPPTAYNPQSLHVQHNDRWPSNNNTSLYNGPIFPAQVVSVLYIPYISHSPSHCMHRVQIAVSLQNVHLWKHSAYHCHLEWSFCLLRILPDYTVSGVRDGFHLIGHVHGMQQCSTHLRMGEIMGMCA